MWFIIITSLLSAIGATLFVHAVFSFCDELGDNGWSDTWLGVMTLIDVAALLLVTKHAFLPFQFYCVLIAVGYYLISRWIKGRNK